MREISPCYNYMLKWFVFIGLLISFNLAESLVPSHYENEVTRSKRDIVDAKTIGNALYEPEEQDVIIRREEIPIPPFDSNVESNNKENLKNTDTQTGEVKSNIEQKQEHGPAATTASSDKKQLTKKTSAKKESLKKLVQTRADVLKKEEDENLLKGMDSNVDHPLIKSDLTKQYRESTELDHGEMMGIETERDDINEPITSDNSLLTKNKNNIKFNEIETDIVPKEHFFNTDNTENKRDNIITTNNVVTTPKKQDNLLLKENVPNLVVSPVVTSTTRPTFTVVKRSATLDNDLLPLSKFESEYALEGEGGGEMADGGPPSHFQVDDKSADLEINANSAGVKVKAKPASLQVVSKPGAHGAGAHPYILPVHHYEYLDDEFHEGHPYRRSSCCHHRHYHHGLRRCCRENPDQLCCHHRRRHRIPRHHRHHHHEYDDDDDDDMEEQRHYIARHRHHHYHPRHVNFSPEEGRNDENAYRRHQIHRRRHRLNFAPQPYDEAGFYHHPIRRPSIDSEMTSPFPDPGRFSASFNSQQYGGFALPGSMSIPDRMMDMDGSRRNDMYNNYNQLPQFPVRPQYPGIPYDSPYFQRFSRSFHAKHKSHDVKGRARSAVETAMDPRLGSVANANGFNSGIALPDEDAMYFGQFRPEAMDERERIHQNHLRKIQDSTYKQFADELAFKQQNIAMDSHSRFQQQQPPLIPSATTTTKQFHQYHNNNAAPLLSHSHEFHSIEDDENHDRGLSYHDSSSSRLTTRQHSDDNGGPPYHEYHHYNGGSSRHSRHRFSSVNPREKYHDHVRYFNEPSQLSPSSPSLSSSSIADEENREDAFEKAELSSHHSDDIEKSEEAARSSPDGGDEMEDGSYEKKRSFLHPRKRNKHGDRRYRIPAGHAPLSPMAMQSPGDDEKGNLGDRTLEQGASSLPEVHGDFGLQTSEQEEALKQDREFEHIAKIQDEMYKKLGAVLPLGDVPRPDYHDGIEPEKTLIKPGDMSDTAMPDDTPPLARMSGDDTQDSHSVASDQRRKELESDEEESKHEKKHSSEKSEESENDPKNNDDDEGSRYNEHSHHNNDDDEGSRGHEEEEEHHRKHHMPHEEYEHDEPNYNSYKKDNLPMKNTTTNATKPASSMDSTAQGISLNKTTKVNGTDQSTGLLTVKEPGVHSLQIEVINGKTENIYGEKKDARNTSSATPGNTTQALMTPSNNQTTTPSKETAEQTKTRRKRSTSSETEFVSKGTKKKNITLTLEKTAHSKGGKKNSVVVQRPPIIYHPPPEIIHRPTIIFHRAPIVLQRAPIVYHQPPVIVHRPAIVYKQPPLVFHQPSPMISQPLIASHDKFVPSFTLQHLNSVLTNAGSVPIFPKVVNFRNNNRRLGVGAIVPQTIQNPSLPVSSANDFRLGGGMVSTISPQAPIEISTSSDNNAAAIQQLLVSQQLARSGGGELNAVMHEDVSEGGRVVTTGSSDGNNLPPDISEVASPSGTGMIGMQDGSTNGGQVDGRSIQVITVPSNEEDGGMRKSNITIGSKKSDVHAGKFENSTMSIGSKKSKVRNSKVHSKSISQTVSNRSATSVDIKKSHLMTNKSMNPTRYRRQENATNESSGKQGVKKDVVVNRPPIIYHPPPEIYHRPDIVIHRPPIVIHRPPIIYHQPPVIVHRPAVVYHQPPIVFHQPPPAVQQPLLYSHDTFVMHPTYVAQHLGSILRTAPHYIGPPRMLTNMGQPIHSTYPMPDNSDDYSSNTLDDNGGAGVGEENAQLNNAQPQGGEQPAQQQQQMIQQDLQNGAGGIENAQFEGQAGGGMEERGEAQQEGGVENMQGGQNGMSQPQDMMSEQQEQGLAKRSHVDKPGKIKSAKHTKIPGYMKQIFDKLYDSSHLSHTSKPATHGNYNIIDQRPGLMRRKMTHKKDKIRVGKGSSSQKVKKHSNSSVASVVQSISATSNVALKNGTTSLTADKKDKLQKQSEQTELATKRNCMEYHDNCCHEMCPPQHAHHVHHHHRHIHHEDHQIVLHRPGVIYHPAPTVVHRPDIIIHRPPLLVHRPVIVVHQPPVILHRPPVYYKQPDVIFHTPHSIVREPTIYSHDMYAHVPHLQQVDSHIENHELTTHIGNECGGQLGYSHGYTNCANTMKGDTYHDKGIGDYYNTQNYGNMGEGENEDDARSSIAKDKKTSPSKKDESSSKRKNIPSSKEDKKKYFHLKNKTESSNSTKRQMIGHRPYHIEPATNDLNGPVPVHHHHHRRLHVGDQNIVLHRPGVIYHPSPTVVHRPIIVIHRPPLLVHRPSIVVHQPPVVIHRPPVYYKQPDVVFHTPPPEVHEPMYQSHDLYKQVPRLEHVDSHIEQTETLVHPGASMARSQGMSVGHGEHYHDKGIGDMYGTSNYGEIKSSPPETKTGTSRSNLPFGFDKEYDFDANSDNNDNEDRDDMNVMTGSPRDNVLRQSQDIDNDLDQPDPRLGGGFGAGGGYYAEPYLGNPEQQQQQQQLQRQSLLTSDIDHSNLLQTDFNSHDQELMTPNGLGMSSMLDSEEASPMHAMYASNSNNNQDSDDDFARRSTIHHVQNSTKKALVTKQKQEKSSKKSKGTSSKTKSKAKKKGDVAPAGSCGECTNDCQPPCLPSGFTSISQQSADVSQADVMNNECGFDDDRAFCQEPICDDQHSCGHRPLEGVSCSGCPSHSQMAFHDCDDHSCNEDEEHGECHPSCTHPSSIQYHEQEGVNGAVHVDEGDPHHPADCNTCSDPCNGHTCNVPVKVDCEKACHAPLTPKLPLQVDCGDNCRPPSTHTCEGDICDAVKECTGDSCGLGLSCKGGSCHEALNTCTGPGCQIHTLVSKPIHTCEGDSCGTPCVGAGCHIHTIEHDLAPSPCAGASCHEALNSCEGEKCHLQAVENEAVNPTCEGDSCHDVVAPCTGSSCEIHGSDRLDTQNSCVGEGCHIHSIEHGLPQIVHTNCIGDKCHESLNACNEPGCRIHTIDRIISAPIHSTCDDESCEEGCEGDQCHTPCVGSNCHFPAQHSYIKSVKTIETAVPHLQQECDTHNGCLGANTHQCILPYCQEADHVTTAAEVCDDNHACSNAPITSEACEGDVTSCHSALASHPITALHDLGTTHQVTSSCLGPACHGPIHPTCQDADCNTPVHVCGGHPCAANALRHCEGHDCHEPVQICGAHVCTEPDISTCQGAECAAQPIAAPPQIGAYHAVVHKPVVVHPVIHHHKYIIQHVMNSTAAPVQTANAATLTAPSTNLGTAVVPANPDGCFCHDQAADCHCYNAPQEGEVADSIKKSKVKSTSAKLKHNSKSKIKKNKTKKVKRSTITKTVDSKKKQMIPDGGNDWNTPIGSYSLGDNGGGYGEPPLGPPVGPEVTRMTAGPPPEVDTNSFFGGNGILGGHGFGDGHIDPIESEHEIRHDTTVYKRPNIVVPQPPDIVHRPDIIIHRAPIIIHRRPVIYHQSPVVVHKPPIIVHQAPIVVHPIVHHHKVITHHVHDYVVQPKVINNECACVGQPDCACEFTLPHHSSSHSCGCIGRPECMCDMNSANPVVSTVGNGLPLSTHDPTSDCNACDGQNANEEQCSHCELNKKKNHITKTTTSTKTKKISLRTLIPHPHDDEVVNSNSNEEGNKKSKMEHAEADGRNQKEEEGKTGSKKRTLNTKSSSSSSDTNSDNKNSDNSNNTVESRTLFNKPSKHDFFTAKKKKKDVVVSRPPIIYHPPPEIYHRPDIVVHRPPLLIHRPSIIYHQPPVIVHRPAVVYHQPPLVFHQPPPAVQQPLLVSHDTFRMHPSAVYTHMGSVVNKVGSYVGVPHGPIVNYPRSPFYGPTGYGPAPPSGYRDFGNNPISYSNEEHLGHGKWPMRNLHHEEQPDGGPPMFNHEEEHMADSRMGPMEDAHERMFDHNEEPFDHEMRHEGGRGEDNMSDDRGMPYGHDGGLGFAEHHGMPMDHEGMSDEHEGRPEDHEGGEMMSEGGMGPPMHHFGHEMSSPRLNGFGGGPGDMNNEMGARPSRQFDSQDDQGKW